MCRCGVRSLIILEVEHGDSTDDIQSYVEQVGRYIQSDSDNMLSLKNYTVRIDVPPCFVLDSEHTN